MLLPMAAWLDNIIYDPKSGNNLNLFPDLRSALIHSSRMLQCKIPSDVRRFTGSYGSSFHVRKIELVFVLNSLGQNSLQHRLRT